ncbi:MAG TPA: hypothetical protein VJK48_07080 [Chlamydiales bacterium]|nr:hypothetical protein [Chlamydiales bacterium]
MSACTLSHYDVVWPKGGVLPSADPQFFFLAELHKFEPIEKINGLFISRVATPGSILLVEEFDFCAPVSGPFYQWIINEKKIQNGVFEEGKILGWDEKGGLQGKYEALSLMYELLVSPDIDMTRFEQAAMEMRTCYQQQIIDRFGQEAMRSLRSIPNITEVLEEYGKLTEEIQKSLEEIAKEWERKLTEKRSEITSLIKKSYPLQGPEGEVPYSKEWIMHCVRHDLAQSGTSIELNESIRELGTFGSICWTELDCLRKGKIEELEQRIKECLASQFPIRTEAMIATLQKVKDTVAASGKIFVIAGLDHFCEPQECQDERFRLTSFYRYLEQEAIDAVVLSPRYINPVTEKQVR